MGTLYHTDKMCLLRPEDYSLLALGGRDPPAVGIICGKYNKCLLLELNLEDKDQLCCQYASQSYYWLRRHHRPLLLEYMYE